MGAFSFDPKSGSAETLVTSWPGTATAAGAAAPALCTSAPTPECAARTPQIALDGSGNGYAVASTVLGSNGDILFARTDPSTGSWEPAQVVGQGYAPHLGVDSGGDVVVIYARDDPNAPSASLGPFPRLYARRLPAGSTTWSAEELVSGPSETTDEVDPSGTALVTGPSGNATAVFPQGTEPAAGGPPNGAVIFAVRWPISSSAPLAEKQVSPSVQSEGGNAQSAVLAVDPQGRLTAAWEVAALNTTIYASHYAPASGWTAGQQVSPQNSPDGYSLPEVAADALGTATLLYVDTRQGGTARLDALRKPIGKPWSPPMVISSSGPGAGALVNGSVQVAAGKAGQADAIFLQSLNGTDRLFATRFDDTTAPTITLGTPRKGATYRLHSKVLAHYSCQDEPGGSGVASCAGTAKDGQPVDTATPGRKTFVVRATDGAGNTSRKTVAYTVTAPAPGVRTGRVTDVTRHSATLTGTVNPHGAPTTYRFRYGTSTMYGLHTAARSAGSLTTGESVSAVISGLKPGTTYHYVLVARSGGGTASGTDRTFTTAALRHRAAGSAAHVSSGFTG
jgi:hypothetical protein